MTNNVQTGRRVIRRVSRTKGTVKSALLKRNLKRKRRFEALTAILIAIFPMVCLFFVNMYNIHTLEEVRQHSIETNDSDLLYQTVQSVPIAYVFRMPTDISSDGKVSDKYYGTYYLGSMVETTKNIKKSDIDYFYNTFSLIPEPITSYLIDNKWKFVLVDDIEDDDSMPMFKTNGMTLISDKIIYIDVDAMRHDGVILHEIGHILYMNGLSNCLNKKGITSTVYHELDDMYLHNAHGNAYLYYPFEEMTAQLFDEYCRYPKSFKEQAPITFGVYEEAINEIKDRQEEVYYEILW